MTSLNEILLVVGMNSSEKNPITVKQICEVINKITLEKECTHKVRSFIDKFPYLFKKVLSDKVISSVGGRRPYKYWLSEKGTKYFNQRTGLSSVEEIKEL